MTLPNKPLRTMKTGPRISVFNYYPLEFMGGGEYTALFLFNSLQKDFSLVYNSSRQFTGMLRVTRDDIENKIKFSYTQTDFLWYSCIKIPTIIKPFPSLDNSDADLNVIYVSGGFPSKFLRDLSTSNRKVLFLMHGVTFERIRFRSISDFLVSVHQISIRITMLSAFKYIRDNENIYFQIFNKSQEKFLKRLSVDSSRVFYIPSGVDFDKYTSGRNETQFRVIFLSRMEDLTKGLKTLGKVVRRISNLEPKIKFILIGAGKDSNMAKSMAIAFSSVEYVGFVKDSEKAQELSNANLMISTSNVEPFPLNVLEGLASGLPIVCNDYSGSWAIKQHKIFGSVSERSINDITANVLLYYKKWNLDKEKYFQEKVLRRNEAKILYDSNVMISEYAKCFHKIIK